MYNFCDNTTDLIDAPLADPSLHPYRHHHDAAHHVQSTLSLAYSYVDNPYLSVPQQSHSPAPLHLPQSRPHPDPVRVPTPSPDPGLSFDSVYPGSTTQRTPLPHSTASETPASMLDYYAATSQQLFPTPSELLSNISHRQQSFQRDIPEPRPYTPTPPRTSRHQSPVDTSSVLPNGAINKTESQRKARQRAIAEEIGFAPTDPDTISSHEKKRHYLECLEQYVLYLHEQLRLVQTAPLGLERVSTYRGLSSRSIRTLLVHMQNTNKTLHEGTLVEEQVFLDLSAQVMAAHNTGLPLRRHSVDVVGGSRNSGYNASLTSFDSTTSLLPEDVAASASPSSVDGGSASPDTSTDMASQRFVFPRVGDGM